MREKTVDVPELRMRLVDLIMGATVHENPDEFIRGVRAADKVITDMVRESAESDEQG